MKTLLASAVVLVAGISVAAGGSATSGRIVFAANNAPKWSGHIYVVHGNGAPVDLSSHTGGLDGKPAVSPDGKLIAFTSTRGGKLAVYTMGIDGRDVRRLSPYLSVGGPNATQQVQSIFWRPDGKLLAALVWSYSGPARIYTATPAGGWRPLVSGRALPSTLSGWTPDGRMLVYVSQNGGGVEGVDAAGKNVFDVPGDAVAISSTGSLAVQRDSETWVTYSASGQQLARLADLQSAAWSPDGSRFATVSEKGVVRVYRGGSGAPTFSRQFRDSGLLGWAGNRIVRVEDPAGIIGVDAATGRRVSLPSFYRAYNESAAQSGLQAAAIHYPKSFNGTQVQLLELLAGRVRTVVSFPTCGGETPVWDIQFFGHDGLAYDTVCVAPNADVYSVAPDGSGLRQLTKSPLDDTEPAVSPDGTRIAYVEKANEMDCHGCPETLWAANVDGTGAHEFPNSPSQDLPYDDQPSFSPDGKTILFVRSGPDSTGLFTVPSTGGPVHDLKLSGTGAVWGPSRIAYSAWPSGTPSTVLPDGTGRTPVNGARGGGVAAWSPDGKLAYLQSSNGRLSILLPASGKRIPLPGFGQTFLGGLAWSPDGSRFAFTATAADGRSDVWTIGIDGSNLTRVTRGLGAVTSVVWG